MRSCDIHLEGEVTGTDQFISVLDMSLAITNLKLQLHLPGANELTGIAILCVWIKPTWGIPYEIPFRDIVYLWKTRQVCLATQEASDVDPRWLLCNECPNILLSTCSIVHVLLPLFYDIDCHVMWLCILNEIVVWTQVVNKLLLLCFNSPRETKWPPFFRRHFPMHFHE